MASDLLVLLDLVVQGDLLEKQENKDLSVSLDFQVPLDLLVKEG